VLDLGRTRPEEAGRGGGRELGFGKEVAGSGSRRGETRERERMGTKGKGSGSHQPSEQG